MTTTTRTALEIHLASRPVGLPTSETFKIVEVAVPGPGPGEALVRNTHLSVEPYMRGRMNAGDSYIPPFALHEAMEGGAVGIVVESCADALRPGDVVLHNHGWREVAVERADTFTKLDAPGIPPSAYLGALGGPGLAAYVGIVDVGALRSGDTVFVSGAAGAVGSMAGQVARLKGASRVIGSAGSAEKVRYLMEDLGFDAAFNYKDGPVAEQLEMAAPDGIDVCFDNVGRDHLEAAIDVMNLHGRVAMCGAISEHNDEQPAPGPRNLFQVILKRLTLAGFIILDHYDRNEAFLEDAEQWVRSGEVQLRETFADGIRNMPEAFLALYRGHSVGKQLVRLGDVGA